MFEVICEKVDGSKHRYVVSRFAKAKLIARSNAEKGYRVRVRRLREDIWVSHPKSSDMILVNSKMQVREAVNAARYETAARQSDIAKSRPNLRTLPPGWRIIRTDW